MSETEEKLLTVNEYAAENHVSRQSVNSKINRHKDELKGHVFIINGRKMIDGFAQDFLRTCPHKIKFYARAYGYGK